MNLEINCYNNLYQVSGILNRANAHIFRKEFKKIFDKVNSLTLSIEGLESIDRYGVIELANLHNESISQKKKLAIVGHGCKDLYNEFQGV
ncbi:MAG: hypothetical protein R2802_06555 [Flavobacteriaceae bacterium]|nr:hypothetical protein [Mangrovimonas sp.]MCB0470855.1 hypothetical protein [Flavobacteriaceae bacterium]MCB0426811.1 hypothetical protein [Mangrovimonas sp.]MCB0433500.1 hypothetical protein [Mangrovimonas sp.]MCB0436619.1 hypothetical protein [Mangrovimonas sp.]